MPYLQFQAFYVCRLLSQEPEGSEAAEWLDAGASRDQTAQPPTKERVYRETPGRQAILGLAVYLNAPLLTISGYETKPREQTDTTA